MTQPSITRAMFFLGLAWFFGIVSASVAAIYVMNSGFFAGRGIPNDVRAVFALLAWLVLPSAGVLISALLLCLKTKSVGRNSTAAALAALALNTFTHPFPLMPIVDKVHQKRAENLKETRQRLGGFQESGQANFIVFSPNGKTLASSYGTEVKLWEVASGKLTATLQGHTQVATGVAFAPSGQTLLSASEDGTVRLWSIGKETPEYKLTGHRGWVNAVAISPDGRTAASGGEDGIVIVWDLEAREERRSIEAKTGQIRSVAFSPIDGILAVAGMDGISLWNPTTGQALPPLQESGGPFGCVAFSHDGGRLVAGGLSGPVATLCLWDVASRQKRQVFQGHARKIGSLSLSADDKYLATSGGDKSVRIWNVDSGQELAMLPHGSENYHVIVAYSPNGKTLAIADVFALKLLSDQNVADAIALKLLSDQKTHVTEAGVARLKQGRPEIKVEVLPPNEEQKRRAQWRTHFETVTWTPLAATEATANGGATLRRLEDGSFLAEGPNPPSGSYRLVSRPTLKRITAVRLDVLRHDSLPNKGPGRLENGTFVLTGVRILQGRGEGLPPRVLPVQLALADYVQREHNLEGLGSAEGGRGSWAIYRVDSEMRDQSLVLELAEPVEIDGQTTFEVLLECASSQWPGTNIGRFRLSVTDAMPHKTE